jgi:hypothetical protein
MDGKVTSDRGAVVDSIVVTVVALKVILGYVMLVYVRIG